MIAAGTRISVVIPVFNGQRFLADALESVAWQTLAPHEVIVVDDGSSDCSPSIAASFAGVRCLAQANAGPAAARNAGVAASAGEVIAFLDQDDLWLPDKLERQLPLLGGSSSRAYVTAQHRAFLHGGTAAPAWVRPGTLDETAESPLPSSWLVPRELFERVGPFDVTYRTSEDLEWVGRARSIGVECRRVPEVLTLRRIHDDNLSGKVAANHATMLRALRSAAGRHAAARRPPS